LQDNLAGNFGIATTTVLVGPFNGKDTAGIVVHALVLAKGYSVPSGGIHRIKGSRTIFSLKRFVAYTTGTSISTVVVILTERTKITTNRQSR
jgi:hypothetical protein